MIKFETSWVYLSDHRKLNFPLTSGLPSVSWWVSVCRLVCWSFCYNFLKKGGKFYSMLLSEYLFLLQSTDKISFSWFIPSSILCTYNFIQMHLICPNIRLYLSLIPSLYYGSICQVFMERVSRCDHWTKLTQTHVARTSFLPSWWG